MANPSRGIKDYETRIKIHRNLESSGSIDSNPNGTKPVLTELEQENAHHLPLGHGVFFVEIDPFNMAYFLGSGPADFELDGCFSCLGILKKRRGRGS
jgi:hypothetical protein